MIPQNAAIAVVMMTIVMTAIATIIATIAKEEREENMCCIKGLKIENGQLLMLICGKWEAVQGGTLALSSPPVNDEIIPPENAPVNGYRCTKADSATKLLSSLGLSAFDVASNNPSATPTEKANLLSLETGYNLSAQYAVQLFQMIDAEEAILSDFGSGVVTTIKNSMFNIFDNSLDMADISLSALAGAIDSSSATSSQKATWTSALSTVAIDAIKNMIAGAAQAGEGDCSDIFQEQFPQAGEHFTVGFEDSETEFFVVDNTRTDIKRTGAKAAGFYAQAPAQSAGTIFTLDGWIGNVSNLSLWCYREDLDGSPVGNVTIKIEGKIGAGSFNTLTDNYESGGSNVWNKFTRSFASDAYSELRVTVGVGSTHAIGIAVDDVEVW